MRPRPEPLDEEHTTRLRRPVRLRRVPLTPGRGRRPARRPVVLLAAVLALVAGCAGAGTAGGDRGGQVSRPGASAVDLDAIAPPRIDWRPCGGAFECAAIAVPMDHRRPAGPTVTLAAVRLPATDPAKRIGTLAVNYGGPGTPATSSLRRLAKRFEGLRARFDLLAVDPRGVGGSAPVRCGRFTDPALDVAPAPLGPPGSPGFRASAGEPGRACREGTGELLSHLSTATSARDLDLVRRGLGEPDLSLYGYSYGTYANATYANLFPDRTRAMVLDGTLDLVANAGTGADAATRPVDVRAEVAGAWEESLGAMLDACAAAGPARCALARLGDPRSRAADVVAALGRGPVGGTTAAALTERVDTALQTAGRVPGLMRTLAGLAAASPPSGGRLGPAPDGGVPGPRAAEPWAPAHAAAFLAVQCTDSVTPDLAAVERSAAAEQLAHPVFGGSAALNTAMCAGWPAPDPDRYLGPWNAPLRAPALIVNSRYDPATPLRNARATAAQLAASRVLVVDGVGHTTLDAPSRCAQDAATAYVLDPVRLPPVGTICPSDATPFP